MSLGENSNIHKSTYAARHIKILMFPTKMVFLGNFERLWALVPTIVLADQQQRVE